jgi:hypothetical protein
MHATASSQQVKARGDSQDATRQRIDTPLIRHAQYILPAISTVSLLPCHSVDQDHQCLHRDQHHSYTNTAWQTNIPIMQSLMWQDPATACWRTS